MDYNRLTNEELINEKKQLEEEFDKCKMELQTIYDKMGFMSENYNTIEEILNKRYGLAKEKNNE